MAEAQRIELDDAPFETTYGALAFAFNHSGQQYDRPIMNRVAAPAVGSGKGLGGMDGAGQAGMIRAQVRDLGRLDESLIVARVAPRSIPCACGALCCRGSRVNAEWMNAIGYLAYHMRGTALAGCDTTGSMRHDYVVRYFTRKGERISLETIANNSGCSLRAVTAHAQRVSHYLGGTPLRPGKSVEHGLEAHAMAAIEEALIRNGVVARAVETAAG